MLMRRVLDPSAKLPESLLFMTCIHAIEDQGPIKGKGLIVARFRDKVTIAITADEGVDDQEIDGWSLDRIKPFIFYIFRNGWLVALCHYNGGEILGDFDFEDFLIDAIKAGKVAA